jgi:nitroimidazol reductase NimA-like FMN-containing flavoprotein (pyridoxamine 5'-phosphate oxidase superfamily)
MTDAGVNGGLRLAVDRHGLEVLSHDECLRLLRRVPVGRIGVSSEALPVVLPVNFALDGRRVVIRTNPGTKLDAAVRNAVVAFEADHYEPLGHEGWSVLVVGRASEITDPDDGAHVRRLPLRAWGTSTADRYVAISMDIVSGRRLSTVR